MDARMRPTADAPGWDGREPAPPVPALGRPRRLRPGQRLRVVPELNLDGTLEPLQRTARVSGSSHAQGYSSALDLLRTIELEAERKGAARHRGR
jgi:hypothetical protein